MDHWHVDPSGRRVHNHLWHNPLSRRQFLGATAAGAGALATAGLWNPLGALAGEQVASAAPRPIPIGVTVLGFPIHHWPADPHVINDASQIFDFNGSVGLCRVRGQGTATDSAGIQTRLNYQVDNGFMDGVYVGLDGKVHRGTFAFV